MSLRHHRLPGRLAVLLSPLTAVLALVGCGGGGGTEMLSVGATVLGQKPGSTLVLQVDNSTQSVTASTYASFDHTFSHQLMSGSSFTVSFVRHPAGQLCRLAAGENGVLSAADRTVQIECSHTVLNDTGIALVPDSDAGRDTEAARLTKTGAGALGFDFTRLCASGDVASGSAPGYGCTATTAFPANAWACTRDNTTGLVWLRAPTAGNAAAPAGQCGVTAWRVPSVHELLSIVHGGRLGGLAAVDTDHFPDTAAGVYLASDTYQDGTGQPWAVDFASQGLAGKYSGALAGARLQWVATVVRPANNATSLLDNAAVTLRRSAAGSDYALVDNQRDLLWLVPTSAATMTWTQAVSSVATVNAARAGGHGDWRLPNRSELDALALRSHSGPAMDAAVFDSGFAQLFWSGSPVVPASGSATSAWAVDFSYGDISPLPQSTGARVLYVRQRTADAAP